MTYCRLHSIKSNPARPEFLLKISARQTTSRVAFDCWIKVYIQPTTCAIRSCIYQFCPKHVDKAGRVACNRVVSVCPAQSAHFLTHIFWQKPVWIPHTVTSTHLWPYYITIINKATTVPVWMLDKRSSLNCTKSLAWSTNCPSSFP